MNDQGIVSVCKKVIRAYPCAWKKRKAIAQDDLKLPKHRLITESPTRWGSRHAMIT